MTGNITGCLIGRHEHTVEFKNRRSCLELSGQRIDGRVHGFSRAFDHAVTNVLGCLHGTPRYVGCGSDRSRLNRANGDGEGENDRKERFHGTKLFVSDGSRAFA